MAELKTILEFLRLLIAAYKFMDNQIDEVKFNHVVKERKKVRDSYREANEAERLRILRDEATK